MAYTLHNIPTQLKQYYSNVYNAILTKKFLFSYFSYKLESCYISNTCMQMCGWSYKLLVALSILESNLRFALEPTRHTL